MSDYSKSSCEIEEANWDSLPPEILIDIVLRLPIKSIVTWRSVSKSWKSLIKNPNFISTHLNHNNHNHTHLLLLRKLVAFKESYSLHWDNEAFDEHTRSDFPFHGRRLNGASNVVGTCTGLVCLADGYSFNSYNFFVWNPCIRKYVTLPKPKPNDVGDVNSTACYPCFHIWVMKEYDLVESWTKVLTVDSQGPQVKVPWIFSSYRKVPMVAGFRKSGEVLIETGERKLFSLDPETKKESKKKLFSFDPESKHKLFSLDPKSEKIKEHSWTNVANGYDFEDDDAEGYWSDGYNQCVNKGYGYTFVDPHVESLVLLDNPQGAVSY